MHEALTGFGYRPMRFFIWTLALFFAVSYLNYVLIGDTIQVAGATGTWVARDAGAAVMRGAPAHASYVDSVFYSFSVLTVLGFSSVTPSSDGDRKSTRLNSSH